MVDELIDFSEYDPELADGIKWLDSEAQKKGITFYDMVFQVLYTHDVDIKTAKLLKQVILIRTAQYVRPRKSMLKKGTSAGTYWNQGVRLLIKYIHVVRHCETEGGRLL